MDQQGTMNNKGYRTVLGALVGGFVAWLAAFIMFGLIKSQLLPAAMAPTPSVAKVIGIYLVMAAALLLAAQAMQRIEGGAHRQISVMLWIVLGVEVLMRFGRAVELPDQYPWTEAVFYVIGETLCLLAGGYVMTRWFLNPRSTAGAMAAT